MAEKTEPKKEQSSSKELDAHSRERIGQQQQGHPQGGKQKDRPRGPQASSRDMKAPHAGGAAAHQHAERSDLRGIVRIAGKDLQGHEALARAISRVKGVGANYGGIVSTIAARDLGVQPTVEVGTLSESQIERIEYILTHPTEFGVPKYLLNRQRDFTTGADRHLIGTDLTFTVKQDIEHEKDIMSWKGYRHAYGQKVRGQRTRSTGRTGMTVGVIRKSILAKAGAGAVTAAAGAQAAGAAAPAGPAAKGAPAAGAKAPAGAGPKAAPAAAPAAKPAAPAKK